MYSHNKKLCYFMLHNLNVYYGCVVCPTHKYIMFHPHILILCSVIIEEETELDKMTQRRVYAGVIQRDLDAPEKPPRGPGISRTPSDSNVKRLSAMSHTSDANRRLSANIDTREVS